MPIKLAREIAWNSSPRCPQCNALLTANGRGQPIAIDDEGRPYCREHGHLAEPDYAARCVEYERRRKALGELLADARKHGVSPTKKELEGVRSEW